MFVRKQKMGKHTGAFRYNLFCAHRHYRSLPVVHVPLRFLRKHIVDKAGQYTKTEEERKRVSERDAKGVGIQWAYVRLCYHKDGTGTYSSAPGLAVNLGARQLRLAATL